MYFLTDVNWCSTGAASDGAEIGVSSDISGDSSGPAETSAGETRQQNEVVNRPQMADVRKVTSRRRTVRTWIVETTDEVSDILTSNHNLILFREFWTWIHIDHIFNSRMKCWCYFAEHRTEKKNVWVVSNLGFVPQNGNLFLAVFRERSRVTIRISVQRLSRVVLWYW